MLRHGQCEHVKGSLGGAGDRRRALDVGSGSSYSKVST